jgi:hypothetical protein
MTFGQKCKGGSKASSSKKGLKKRLVSRINPSLLLKIILKNT